MKWPDDFVNKIICGDCLEVLARVPGDSIDLIFADPPFNIGKNYGTITKDKIGNYYQWCESWIDLCFQKLKETDSFYLMTLSRHLGKIFPILEDQGVFINLIMWRNVSASHSKRNFWGSYQPILLYGKTKKYTFNTYAEVRDIKDKNLRWGGYSTKPRGQLLDYWDDISFVYAGSIYHPEAIIKPGTNKKVHPCQSPLGLVSRAILFSTKENDLILDPFSGSGTTSRAAKDLKRNFIVIEINPDYCKMNNKRLAQGVL